jgi:Ca2+-binding EF-hand superfamily protein
MKTIKIHALVTVIALAIIGCSSSKRATDSTTKTSAPNTSQIMTEMDSNKDGKLSMDEVKGPIKNDFSKIDSNSDGFISKEELNKAPKPNKQGPPQVQDGPQGPPPPNR